MQELIDELLDKIHALPEDDEDLREIYLALINLIQIQRRSINKLMRKVMNGGQRYHPNYDPKRRKWNTPEYVEEEIR